MDYRIKVLAYGMLVFGGLATIVGMTFVALYVRDAVIARAGEPDQSLLFWYIPILFTGVISMIAGLGIGAWGVSLLRKMRRQIPH